MRLIQINPDARRDVRAFLHLPFDIYRNVPQWVPPLMPGERARFQPGYSFYRHSTAAFFLVYGDDGQPVGRIAVMDHRPHNEYRGNKDALLYLYEAIDDDRVARMLFDAAESWARGRGLTRLLGPKGFMTADGHGLLVEGFEHRPAIGIPYNPPYYVRQWEQVGGMGKVIDYLSAFIDREGYTYPERLRRIATKIRQRRDFYVPEFKSKAELRAQAEKIKRAYNNAFVSVWAYTPIPDEDLDAIVDRILLIADPKLLKLIFKGDEIAGFQFAYPDVSAAIQRSKGRLWPFGAAMILREKRRTRWLNVNGNAILPKYQGTGANAILYDEMFKSLESTSQYRYADLVQVQETNAAMLGDLAAIMPTEIYKRHRVYEKELG